MVKPRIIILAIIPSGMFGAKTTLHITERSPCPWRSIVRSIMVFFSWTKALFKVVNNVVIAQIKSGKSSYMIACGVFYIYITKPDILTGFVYFTPTLRVCPFGSI